MPLFRRTILFLILIELLSFCAWLFPVFNAVCFFVILFLVFALSLKRLSHGLLAALGELIIGSHGYLFSLNLSQGSSIISLRLGIFMVVMLAWAINTVRSTGLASYWHQLKKFRFFRYYLFLAIVLIWGFFFALIRGNDFGNIFLDFNNWLFFLYLLPLVSVKNDKNFWHSLKTIALACLSWLIIKTLLLFYIFSHQFIWALPEAYLWIRDTKVGEITRFTGSFYRVFLQSQIYALLGFFILLPFIKKIRPTKYNLLAVACLSVVLVSLSRSFWAGLILGLIFYFIVKIYELLITNYKLPERIKNLAAYFLRLIFVAFLSFVLLFAVAYAPPKINGNLSKLFGDRATQMEAAGSSRLSMLKPLLMAIANHPVIGSGFGTTVTYKSLDPRVIPTTAGGSGQFTTYAFEWGYLDLLLKIGLAGLFIYLLLIYKLLHVLWTQINFKFLILNFKINSNPPAGGQIPNSKLIQNSKFKIQNLSLGLSLALIALLSVNIFTPYLNHPLGIGFILVVSVWLDYNKKIIIP